MNKTTIYIATAVCTITLLTGCNGDKDTAHDVTPSTVEATNELTPGGEEHEHEHEPLLVPTYTVGSNNVGTLKYGEEIGGSFRVTQKFGENTVDYDLQFTDVSGFIGANVYITLPDEMSLDTFLLATELTIPISDVTKIGDNTYFYFTMEPQIAGFDDHISQKANYEAVCKEFGIEEGKAPNAPTDKLVINQDKLKLKLGETITIELEHIPDDYDLMSLTYSVEDPSIAEVDTAGNLTAISVGATALTVTTDDGAYFAQGIVVVNS